MSAKATGLPADRRTFLKTTAAVLSTALVRPPRGLGATPAEPPIMLGEGPHLFIDDFLVVSGRQLTRTVHLPERLANPVIDRSRFGPTQPYASVLRDPAISGYRLWYNRGSAIWQVKSDDGIAWRDPRVSWDLPRAYGCSLIDDVGREADVSRRFKLANWRSTRALDDTPQDDSGIYVGFSPDGLKWRDYSGNPVLKTWDEGYGKISLHGVGDIIDAYYDPLQRCYAAAVKVHARPGEGYPPGPKAGTFGVRPARSPALRFRSRRRGIASCRTWSQSFPVCPRLGGKRWGRVARLLNENAGGIIADQQNVAADLR